jgi:hypothetical protein
VDRVLPLLVPLLLAQQLAVAAAPAARSTGPAPSTAAVRLTIETIAVDRRGTWSLGSDIADLFSGATGVLEKSATLIRRGDETGGREMVQMTARLTPILGAGGVCTVRIETVTRGVVAGAAAGAARRKPDKTRATIVLKPDQDRLVDVYSSSATQGRLALKIRFGRPTTGTESMSESDLRFVDFVLSVARGDSEKDPQPMKTDHMRAVVGREASDLFSFNVPLEPDAAGGKRYRREKLEVNLTPTLLSGDQVQIVLSVRGEMATVGADTAPIVHPIEHADTVVVTVGETRDIDIDVRSSGPEEGWERVRYRLSLVGTF